MSPLRFLAEAVLDNKFTTWANSLPEVPENVKDKIRELARELFPEIAVPISLDVPGYVGKRIANFDEWVFKNIPGTSPPSYLVDLPKVDPKDGKSLWSLGEVEHRKWLDAYFLKEVGYARPDNYVWHHHHLEGKIQLVERAIPVANGNDGPFVEGGWASIPGKVGKRR